jgi:hypothetical protein
MSKHASADCFCAATFCQHEGSQCGKPVTFQVEIVSYDGKTGTADKTFRKIGICNECWEAIQENVPGFFGGDK